MNLSTEMSDAPFVEYSASAAAASRRRNSKAKKLRSKARKRSNHGCPHPSVPIQNLDRFSQTRNNSSESMMSLHPQQVYDAYKAHIDAKIEALPTFGKPCTRRKLFKGEFGYEIQGIVPWYYDKHTTNKCDLHVEGTTGSRYLYWFASSFVEIKIRRKPHYLPLDGPLHNIDPHNVSSLPTTNWTMPNWRDFFGGNLDTTSLFPTNKPIAIIFNKFAKEWGQDPVNYLDINTLRRVIYLLSPTYQIVYVRMEVLALDDQEDEGDRLAYFKDKETIRREYPTVVVLDDIYNQTTMDWNLLLFGVASNAELFVSVQGGTSVIASLWKAPNFIFAARGHELIYNTYRKWYGKLGGSTVRAFNYRDELVDAIRMHQHCRVLENKTTMVPYISPKAKVLLRYQQINHTRNERVESG